MYRSTDFFSNLKGDLYGGLTAGVVALPLSLAFGIASGAGPAAGLYGAMIVGFFAAVFGGTRTQISGPTGPMAVVMAAMISDYTLHAPEQALALAFTTVVLGGLLQMGFGFLRLGQYIIMVPYPVISGFMNGIGIIIILLQLAPLMGLSSVGAPLEALLAVPQHWAAANPEALLIGGISLLVVFLWRGRCNRLFPAPLLALILATGLCLWAMPGSDIPRVGSIPVGLPSLQWPTLTEGTLRLILINALMLAVLGSIDSLLTSLVADSQTGTRHHSDRELIGQGLGNTLAGLFGGLPGAGATMRTMVNIRAGGSGPLSGAIHGLLLFATAAGLGVLFEQIPLAALAGLLIKVGIDIIDWPFLRRLRRVPVFSLLLMLLVMGLTIFVDLITAVFVGVFIKNIVTLHKLSHLQLGEVLMSDGERHGERLSAAEREALQAYAGRVVLFRLSGPVSYAVGSGIAELFRQQYRSRERAPEEVIVDVSRVEIIGISSALVLEEVIAHAQRANARVWLVGLNPSSHPELEQLGIAEQVGQDYCRERFTDVMSAIQHGS